MTTPTILLLVHIVAAIALLFVEGVPLLKVIAAYIVLEGFFFYFYGKRRETKATKRNSRASNSNN